MPKKARKVMLVVLDGYAINPLPEGNAVWQAQTPTIDMFYKKYPYAVLEASSLAVGLPWGEVGNSEVGHMNLGSGLVIYQSLPRISVSIENKSFFSHEVLLKAVAEAKKRKSRIHLSGLCSNGGVHSHIEHLHALLALMKEQQFNDVFVHAISDGRDTAPYVAANFMATLLEVMKTNKVGQLASLVGRYFAMDRNNKWDRTGKAYDLMIKGQGKASTDIIKTLKEFYAEKISDEMIEPIVMVDKNEQPVGNIRDNDVVINFNFRPDRARQLTQAFVLDDVTQFNREQKKNLHFVTMMQYAADLPVEVVFPPQEIADPVGKILAANNKKQLRIAETEKYAHITYFFNGGNEEPFNEEKHLLVPSPDVTSYDTVPEMSAIKVTEKLLAEISKDEHDFILVNYANPDMVGHTGNFEATIKGIEQVDGLLQQLHDLFVVEQGNVMMITSDHGNCDVMIDPISQRVNKEHTTNPVPFFILDKDRAREKSDKEIMMQKILMTPIGILADVAPTILDYMEIEQVSSMTGRSIINDCI